MSENFELKTANKVFGDDFNMRLVTTNKMFRRTIKYQRDKAKLDIVDAKHSQAISKYYRDITQIQEEIDRLSSLDSTSLETNKRIANLMDAINSKVDPTLDEEYILQTYDAGIDRFDLNLEFLNDVFEDVLSVTQINELNEVSGTPIQALAEEVSKRVLNIPDEVIEEESEETESEEEGLKD